MKGTSSNMLKASAKRRRTRAEIEEEKDLKRRKDDDTMAKLRELDVLKARILEIERRARRQTRVHSPLRQSEPRADNQLGGNGDFSEDSALE